MIRRSRHQDTPRWQKNNKVLAVVTAVFAAFAVLFASSPAYAATNSLGAKSCDFDYSVRVQSLAQGASVYHYGYTSGGSHWRTTT